jgi:hypothetical protein
LKKWVPEEPWRESSAYYRILCGNTLPSGHQCGHDLGYADRLDPQDSASALAGGVAYLNLEGSDLAYAARSDDGAAALGLRVNRRPSVSDVTETSDNEQDLTWVALHNFGYRWVEKGGYFEILRKHKLGLSGRHAARRPMPRPLAARLEKELNRIPIGPPDDRISLSVERGIVGDTPELPALIRCPRCSTPQRLILNDVRPPAPE